MEINDGSRETYNTSSISKINNTEIDHAKTIDSVMLIYNSIEYSDNFSKTSGYTSLQVIYKFMAIL